MNLPRTIGREVIDFFRGHWVHLLIAPGMALTWVTFLHEAAHSAAAWGQGGTITEFSILPGGGNYGHMAYSFPAGALYSPTLISLAPYLMWGTMAAFVAGLALLRRKMGVGPLASTLFVWGFAVPLLDIGNAAMGHLAGHGDLARALGPPDLLWGAGWTIIALASFLAGYPV